MKHFFTLILLAGLATLIYGQSGNQPMRLELDARPNTEPFEIIPLARHGLLVLLKTNETEDRENRRWVLALYNTQLELQWELIQPVLRNLEYRAYALGKNEISLLFYDHRSSSEPNFQIVSINLSSKQVQLAGNIIDRRYELATFTRSGKFVIIGMNSKDDSKAYRFNTGNGEINTLELNPEAGRYIENIQTDTVSGALIVLTSMRNERRRNGLYLQRFDENGSQQNTTALMKNENRKMTTSAQFVPLGGNSFMVLGAYTSNPGRRAATGSDLAGNRSGGFYRVYSSNGSQSLQVDFFRFSDFSNLESYIRGTAAEQRSRSRGGWFQRSGSQNPEYYMTIHRIKQFDEGFLISGEAFTPDFRTVTTIAYDYYGRPVPRSYSVFDGYRYSHAVVAAFDKQGRLLWDNGMEMINIRTFDLNPKLVLFPDEAGVAMAYNHDGKIAWKQINGMQTITGISYANIETRYSRDRVNSEQSSRLFHWYGHYFLAAGYQTIINNYLPDQTRRNVFYISKIAFD